MNDAGIRGVLERVVDDAAESGEFWVQQGSTTRR